MTAAIDARSDGWSAEYRFRRKDGGWVDVFDRGYLLRGEDGRPLRMIGGIIDLDHTLAVVRHWRGSRNLTQLEGSDMCRR